MWKIAIPLVLVVAIFASGCAGPPDPEPAKFFGVWEKETTQGDTSKLTLELKSPNRFVWTDVNSPVFSGTFKTNETGNVFLFLEPKKRVAFEAKNRGTEYWDLPFNYRFEEETLVLVPVNGSPEMRMQK